MPQAYVVRFVSLESGVGKTLVASKVVRGLKAKGYPVSVVKHCAGGVDLEDKDSGRYLESGADSVVLSAPGLAVVYVTNHSDTLENAVVLAKTPVVVVEGFSDSPIGDCVLVVRGKEDLEELLGRARNAVAVVSRDDVSSTPGGFAVFRFGSEEDLVAFLENRIIEHFYLQTPGTDCGACNYPSCRDLAKAYLKGRANWCPVTVNVELVVDGHAIPLNPFVKSVVRSLVKGLLGALKGIPSDYRKVHVVVEEWMS